MDVGRPGRISVEDIIFLIRKDPKKYSRVKELLIMNEELRKARKAFDEVKYVSKWNVQCKLLKTLTCCMKFAESFFCWHYFGSIAVNVFFFIFVHTIMHKRYTLCLKKTSTFLFWELISRKLGDLDNFWYTASCENLMPDDFKFAYLTRTVPPQYLEKSKNFVFNNIQ